MSLDLTDGIIKKDHLTEQIGKMFIEKKVFIWDFHDTLETGTIEILTEIANILLKENGSEKRYTSRELAALPSFSWKTFFKEHLPDLTERQIRKVAEAAYDEKRFSYLSKKYSRARKDAKRILRNIKKHGHINIIISNSKHDKLGLYIKNVGIDHLIDEYYGIDDGTIKSRTDVLKKKVATAKDALSRHPHHHVYAAGDSESDFNMARALMAEKFFWVISGPDGATKGKIYKDAKAANLFFVKDLKEIASVVYLEK